MAEIFVEEKVVQLQQRYELALLGNNDGLWDWNLENDSVYYSPRYKEMLGYSEEEFKGELSSWERLIHPDDLKKTLQANREHIEGKTEYYKCEYRLKHKKGHWLWILARGKSTCDADGNTTRMTGTHTDITEKKELEQNLRDSKQYFKAIYNGNKDGIAILDKESNFLQVNPAYIEMTGMSEEELLSTSCVALSAPEDVARSVEVLKKVLEIGYVKNYEKRCKVQDGSYRYVNMSISLLENTTRILLSVRDVTDQKMGEIALKEQKDILNYQAHHDVLTKLPNRLLFHDRLKQAIEKAKRNKTKIALLFIDLDHFKEINDSLGHDAGDEVLQIVSARLQKTLRDEDTLARLGGDEFTIILEDIHHLQDASLIATKILESLSHSMNVAKNVLYVSTSIGISVYPDDGHSSQHLLKFADAAMYKAKDEGRNNFQYYNSVLTELAFERVVMETSLREALENEEFVVYYQAQVNATTNKIIGMEALVRWEHPTMGLVLPDSFIPLAISTGLIVQLDRYVMKTAMMQLSQWYKNGLNPGVLALNLAIKQLQQEDYIAMVENLIIQTQCKTEWFELEVTEGEIMSDPDKSIRILQKISALGIKLSIDDFGTGYSSLAYLKKLPLDKLKIDQAFIENLPDDEEDTAIVKAVIALAKSLKLKIIAEGVETKEQKDFLVANGCENIQGYFYSKPVCADAFEKLLYRGL